ncbi:unnamed protein product [Bursaphelenchus xylophilus]|uniref:(pine wood nematode) hypothetical protein n=1 Tax=Bursaphelenchus xylophilus TaxID=6326 RepID=A0A1I7RMW2_BURXY|nr:unnamed protein product [Bursaphelenchus xylophilus]CAG9125406.1 unnamed protein product [Bursaphelenchus xylophilus]
MDDPCEETKTPPELRDNSEVESKCDLGQEFGNLSTNCDTDSEIDVGEPPVAGFYEVFDNIERFNDVQVRRSERPRKKKVFDDTVTSFSDSDSDVDLKDFAEKLKTDVRVFDRSNGKRQSATRTRRITTSQLFRVEDPEAPEDPELTQFLRTGTFKTVAEQTSREQFDAKRIDEKKFERTVDSIIKKSWFEDDVKAGIKNAVDAILCHGMTQKRAVRQFKLQWMDLDSILTRIYEKFGFDESGFKVKKISFPKFQPEIRNSDEKDDEFAPPESQDFESSEDEQVSGSDGIEVLSRSAELQMFGREDESDKSKRTSNNFAILGKHANGRKYARYGIYIPSHWKKYKDAMKAGICRSLEFHNYRSQSMLQKRVGVADKYLAIEDVLVNGGSVKRNAMKYNINYSTLQNFSHRAIYVISKVLGETKVLPETVSRREEDQPWDVIFREMVSEAPACCVRVIFKRRK